MRQKIAILERLHAYFAAFARKIIFRELFACRRRFKKSFVGISFEFVSVNGLLAALAFTFTLAFAHTFAFRSFVGFASRLRFENAFGLFIVPRNIVFPIRFGIRLTIIRLIPRISAKAACRKCRHTKT